MLALKDKYVIHHDGCRIGQIVAVGDSSVLVQWLGGPPAFPMELICLEEMVHARLDEDLKAWGFFDSREQLDAYVDWLDSPAEPSVVRLVPAKSPP